MPHRPRTLFGWVAVMLFGTSLSSIHGTSSPVIGILSQPHENRSRTVDYIAASYVKWLEAGGARSIPIPYESDPAMIDEILTQINGVLLPGGSSHMPEIVFYLLNKTVQENLAGNYFPVWGTCMGFEFLLQFGGAGSRCPTVLQSGFDAYNISLPLEVLDSRGLYADSFIYKTVTERNITLNNHHKAITPSHFLQISELSTKWKITSVNKDRAGRPFVSTIEPISPVNFPFYGVQYHPEKNAFEYATYPGTNIPYEAIDHSEAGVYFSMYMARFFVGLARKSQQINPQKHDYTRPDLYPYVESYPVETGLKFEELFIIPRAKGNVIALEF